MRLSNDSYYLHMLRMVAARSTCARRSVGAIIVDERNRVLSMGFNGVPSGFPHCIDTACPGAQDQKGDTRRCFAIHAEINAFLQCNQLHLARAMYITCTPCFACAKAIANTHIKRVVCLEKYADPDGELVLQQAGVELIIATIEP